MSEILAKSFFFVSKSRVNNSYLRQIILVSEVIFCSDSDFLSSGESVCNLCFGPTTVFLIFLKFEKCDIGMTEAPRSGLLFPPSSPPCLCRSDTDTENNSVQKNGIQRRGDGRHNATAVEES